MCEVLRCAASSKSSVLMNDSIVYVARQDIQYINDARTFQSKFLLNSHIFKYRNKFLIFYVDLCLKDQTCKISSKNK